MSVGSFITEDDITHRNKVVVLGTTTAETLFPNEPYPIGRIVRLNGVPFEVVGLLEEKGGSGPVDPDDVALIPLTTAQTRLFYTDTYRGQYVLSGIEIQATSDKDTTLAEAQITTALRTQHGLVGEEEDDFEIMNQAEMIDTATGMVETLTIFLGAVAAISLVVGGIGIMNIMLVSVTERTREIGLRKAIGAGGNDILLQFLIEAMGLSATGGLIGIAFGVFGSRLIGPQVGVSPVTQPQIVVVAAGFSALIGIAFGIYPAMRASSLQPVVALRYE
jgi:putative ABC transport system permease protein